MGGLDPETLQHIWLTGTTIVLFSRELKLTKKWRKSRGGDFFTG